MPRLNAMCINFENRESRHQGRSIYRLDHQRRYDPYDLDKVSVGFTKTTKGSERGNYLQFSKQQTRNHKALCHGTVGEAFANNERENKKAENLKHLLMQAQ